MPLIRHLELDSIRLRQSSIPCEVPRSGSPIEFEIIRLLRHVPRYSLPPETQVLHFHY